MVCVYWKSMFVRLELSLLFFSRVVVASSRQIKHKAEACQRQKNTQKGKMQKGRLEANWSNEKSDRRMEGMIAAPCK